MSKVRIIIGKLGRFSWHCLMIALLGAGISVVIGMLFVVFVLDPIIGKQANFMTDIPLLMLACIVCYGLTKTAVTSWHEFDIQEVDK
jgi:predicted membrane protein